MRYIPYQIPLNGTAYQGIPTIGSIGGYNNPYYNQYLNPYYLRQQEEFRKKLEQQERENQAEIWKKLFRCEANAFGRETISDEEYDEYFKRLYAHQQQEAEDNRFMESINRITQQAAKNYLDKQAREAAMTNQQNNQSQDNKSFYEWLASDASERYLDSQYYEMAKQQKDTSVLYDSDHYHHVLGSHQSVFNALNPNVNIDDMEIQVNLPERIRTEREKRRRQFIMELERGNGFG